METVLKKIKGTSLNIKTCLCFAAASIFHSSATAQQNDQAVEPTSVFSNPMFIALLSIAIILLLIIIVFADMVKAGISYQADKEKKKTFCGKVIKMVIVLVVFGAGTLSAQPGEGTVLPGSTSYWFGLDGFTFYMMLSVIGIELLVVWGLYSVSMQLFEVKERAEQKKEKAQKAGVKTPSLIEKINASVSIEQEAAIMLDHNYDGIQELDNDLPPWWKYGFYLTIVFSIIYLVHFHVINTGKLQLGEYEDQLATAKVNLEAYKKKAANLVDESNVMFLNDAASLGSGKLIYMDNCAACHGRAGEGGVGPNLTDDYWLHMGGIKDIFKTIKYGWPEKGMKAWQQDLGAKQINEVASYVKSLYGSKPANAKEQQGELYKEQPTGSDSTKTVATDTLQVANILK